MEILKRAKGNSGEIIGPNESESNVREEVNRRTWKAGYTDRDGQMKDRPKIMSQGIGESKYNLWPRDEQGNLIDD